ncbi:uncharacterized protein LOC126577103 [Anopheles aquasalis]|uniref:uncharacterized protein LOC126577103 n=1 Tax=Anopheles aquasalis TaxID=42839 RepID=UPI00215B3D81|nr:uncharacterized protein LOC126577103 [Anopheles aquasalis]
MHQLVLVVALLAVQLPRDSSAVRTCTEQSRKIVHRFYLLRHCQRSERNVIGLANVKTVRNCADLARSKQAMAFNYAPAGRNGVNRYELTQNQSRPATWIPPKAASGGSSTTRAPFDDFYNCQVLDCPEHRNLSSIVNDTRFDYYSMFAKILPPAAATCIPSIGMFLFEETKHNYSRAYNSCVAQHGGSLAHVASDRRTFEIARVLGNLPKGNDNSSLNESLFYVGLNESIRDRFFTSAGERLDCFTFRAWAPGHPANRSAPGCVALTEEGSWKVFNCNRNLPYVCELHTSGPALHEPKLRRRCSIKRPNNRDAPPKRVPIE